MKEVGSGFMHHPRLGYLCACPSNIGTGLRASVHVQLHKLSKVWLSPHIQSGIEYVMMQFNPGVVIFDQHLVPVLGEVFVIRFQSLKR